MKAACLLQRLFYYLLVGGRFLFLHSVLIRGCFGWFFASIVSGYYSYAATREHA